MTNNSFLCERFEPKNHFISRLSMTDRVNVLLHRTVVVDSDLRPGALLTYFNDGGEGGGGGFEGFLWV